MEKRTSLQAGIENLYPGYFALVMATGIVSIASHLLGMDWIAWGLLWINLIAYLILWAMLLTRLVRYFPRVISDLASHARGPGFFTLIAGTCVLGAQLILLAGQAALATALWVLGTLLWVLVMYAFFTAVMVRQKKPNLEEGINGAWLIATVATQSVAILGVLISARFGPQQEIVLFFALVMYFIGCMLYLSIITLIFYRFTFLELTSAAVTPPYWINMGAVAITTLAGSTLILNASGSPFLQEILMFLKGFTLFFWATGAWWIPILFILGAWRHLVKHYPLQYDPQYWGMVFPLGMFTTCTYQYARAAELPFLLAIPRYFVYIALLAWLLTFLGLLWSLGRQLWPEGWTKNNRQSKDSRLLGQQVSPEKGRVE
jgi:tellurite resistance protein TehA-like permease